MTTTPEDPRPPPGGGGQPALPGFDASAAGRPPGEPAAAPTAPAPPTPPAATPPSRERLPRPAPAPPRNLDPADGAEEVRRGTEGRLRRFLIGEGGAPSASGMGAGSMSAGGMVAGAAGIVALGFVLSRLLGLLRSVAIAQAFGTDPDLSAYWVAFRLPDLVFQLLAGATLSSAFIPTFSRVRSEAGAAASWRLASSVLNLISIATVIAAGAAYLVAPIVVPLLAPGLGEATGERARLLALAVDLTRVMLLSPLFFGVSGMLTGILNARQHFIAPAIAPLIYNLSIIAGALLLARPYGVHGLAWGVIAGSAGHLLVQLPALRGVGMRWTPALDAAASGVREVLRLMGPRVAGLAAAQVNFLAVIFFASFISDEAISAVTYAFLMMMLPVGVIGMAISTAVFPTLAGHAAARELPRLRGALARSLRTILLLAIPASAGLMLLATPIVRVLLERGAFEADATALVASVLVVYAAGVFAHCGVEILSRGFYALSDTRTPVGTAVLAMVINLALAAILIGPFGLRGLGAAATLAALVEFALLLVALHRRLGGLDLRALRRTVIAAVAGSAVMAAGIVLTQLLLARSAGLTAATPLGAVVTVLVAGSVGGLAYLAVAARVDRDGFAGLIERLR